METKKCAECGKELPVSEYREIANKHGGVNVFTICNECLRKRQSEGHKKRKQKEQAEANEKIAAARRMKLSDFTPREMMEELKRRGYSFTMRYVEEHIINSDNL